MAEPLRNTAELQKQLNEFQETQRQLQVSVAQRQQLALQLEEIKMAEEALSKADKGVYRAIGPLLVETSRSEAVADLKSRKELFEMRTAVLTKQEEKLRPKFDELRAGLEKALRENRTK